MRLKLDENLGTRGAAILRAGGHDVTTVAEQAMTRAGDAELLRACTAEDRCLVTLDLDFSNPLQFDPAESAGIAVIRASARLSSTELDALATTLAVALNRAPIKGKLWIVEHTRVREYAPEKE